MAKTMQELVGMESPFEASLKAVGYKAPETKEQEKYIKEKSEADEAVAKGKTRIAEESLKTREELYARPDLQKQKIEAFAPTPESGSDLAKLFALTTAITFFGGGKGRYSGQAAMGNLASAMDGYKKGRKDLFAQEMKEYDKNMKSAMENNKLIEDKLKEYLDLAAKKDESALVKLAEVQALTGRQGGLAQIEKMSGENLAKHAETLGKARADWIKHVMDIQNKAADREAASFVEYQDPATGNIVLLNKRTGQVKPVEGTKGFVKPSTSGSAGGMGGETYALIERYGIPAPELNRMTKDEKATVAGKVESARQTSELADLIAKNPSAAGIAGSFLNKIDKYLPANYANVDVSSARPAMYQAIDSDPSMISEARIIAKKTLDVINARALSVSKRLLVSELKMQKDVLDISNMSSKSAYDVYKALAKDDVQSLQKQGLSDKTIKDLKNTLNVGAFNIPKAATDALKSGAGTKEQFDEQFGEGATDSVLGIK